MVLPNTTNVLSFPDPTVPPAGQHDISCTATDSAGGVVTANIVVADTPLDGTYHLTPRQFGTGGIVENTGIPIGINPGDTVRVRFKTTASDAIIDEPVGVQTSSDTVGQTASYDSGSGFWYVDVVIPTNNTSDYYVNVAFETGASLSTVTVTIAGHGDKVSGVVPNGTFGHGMISGATFPAYGVPLNSLINIPLLPDSPNYQLYALTVNGIPTVPEPGTSLSSVSTTTITVNALNISVVAYFQRVGDLNIDGRIDIYDLNILLSIWDTAETQKQLLANGHISRDINRDGNVDMIDASLLLTNYNT